MRKIVILYATVALLAFGSLPPAPAHAANNVSYISGTAPPGNPCTLTAPCRSMSEALAQTPVGNDIVCLDEGNFVDPNLIITQTVTIDCTARRGRLGGYTINAPGSTVIIRGGTYMLNYIGTYAGLRFFNGNTLIVEDCVMSGTTTGILVQNATGSSNVVVNNCTIASYGGAGQAGVWVQPAAGNLVAFTINRTVIEDIDGAGVGGTGVFVDGSQGGRSVGVVSNSFISNNKFAGIYVSGSAGTSVTIDNSSVVDNGFGVEADASIGSVTVSLDRARVTGNVVGVVSMNGAAMILNNSTIQANQQGLFALSGGAIFSYGNNAINGNQPNGNGTAPIVIGLH
jgi:hypothetical protein